MAIITITRGSLRAARDITLMLSKELGYRAVMREEVIQHGEKYGLNEFHLAHLETMEKKPPTFWDRHGLQRHHYVTVFRAALMDFVVQDNVIYQGNLGQFCLAEVPQLLRIRVDADRESRILRIVEETGATRVEAEALIADIDNRRRAWVRFLYGADFGDITHYDLILNMAKIRPATMVDTVSRLVANPAFAVDPEAKKTLRNLHLKAVILAHLIRSPRTRGMELDVECDSGSGKVSMTGVVPMLGTEIWERDIKAVVSEVEGVSEVHVQIGV
ncbi:MAG: cytidylate kinase-like family protein [bacterium]|nr:cytidylate kinase-like family protein [bacterium]